MSGAYQQGTKIKGTELRKLGDVAVVTCFVRRDSLKAADWNPPIRVQLQYLGDLRDSMEQDGFWEWQPLIVARDGTIVDGHRRWTVAGLLQFEQVPVVIVDMDPGDLWARLNGTRMDLTGAQAMQAVARGLKSRPPKFAKQIDRLEAIIGPDGIRVLSDSGMSPHLYNKTKQIARYCGLDEDVTFMRLTVFWLAKHRRMHAMTSAAIKEGVPYEVIERAIRSDTPLSISFNS